MHIRTAFEINERSFFKHGKSEMNTELYPHYSNLSLTNIVQKKRKNSSANYL